MVKTECRVFVVKRFSTRCFRPRRPRVCAPTAATCGGEGGCTTDGRAQARLTDHEDEGIPRRTRADRHGNVAVRLAPRQPVCLTADQRTHTAIIEAQSDQCAQPRYVSRRGVSPPGVWLVAVVTGLVKSVRSTVHTDGVFIPSCG